MCRCKHEKCTDVPVFGRWEDGNSKFCTVHKQPGDVDVVSLPFQVEQRLVIGSKQGLFKETLRTTSVVVKTPMLTINASQSSATAAPSHLVTSMDASSDVRVSSEVASCSCSAAASYSSPEANLNSQGLQVQSSDACHHSSEANMIPEIHTIGHGQRSLSSESSAFDYDMRSIARLKGGAPKESPCVTNAEVQAVTKSTPHVVLGKDIRGAGGLARLRGGAAQAASAPKGCTWNKEEDAELLRARKVQGEKWAAIATCLQNKSPKDCKLRFAQLESEPMAEKDGRHAHDTLPGDSTQHDPVDNQIANNAVESAQAAENQDSQHAHQDTRRPKTNNIEEHHRAKSAKASSLDDAQARSCVLDIPSEELYDDEGNSLRHESDEEDSSELSDEGVVDMTDRMVRPHRDVEMVDIPEDDLLQEDADEDEDKDSQLSQPSDESKGSEETEDMADEEAAGDKDEADLAKLDGDNDEGEVQQSINTKQMWTPGKGWQAAKTDDNEELSKDWNIKLRPGKRSALHMLAVNETLDAKKSKISMYPVYDPNLIYNHTVGLSRDGSNAIEKELVEDARGKRWFRERRNGTVEFLLKRARERDGAVPNGEEHFALIEEELRELGPGWETAPVVDLRLRLCKVS